MQKRARRLWLGLHVAVRDEADEGSRTTNRTSTRKVLLCDRDRVNCTRSHDGLAQVARLPEFTQLISDAKSQRDRLRVAGRLPPCGVDHEIADWKTGDLSNILTG